MHVKKKVAPISLQHLQIVQRTLEGFFEENAVREFFDSMAIYEFIVGNEVSIHAIDRDVQHYFEEIVCERLLNENLYYFGLFLGFLSDTMLRISMDCVRHFIARYGIRCLKAYLVLQERSSLLFTYDRDVLSEGVKEVAGTPQPGGLIAVLDEDRSFIGLARYLKDPSAEAAHEVIALNVADIGWYLREGG